LSANSYKLEQTIDVLAFVRAYPQSSTNYTADFLSLTAWLRAHPCL